MSILVRVSVAVIKHHSQNQLVEETVYLILQLMNLSLREVKAGTQSRNQEAGTEAETMVTDQLFMDSSSCFLTQSGMAPRGLGPSTSVIN